MTEQTGPRIGANMLLWTPDTNVADHGDIIRRLVKGGAQTIEVAVFGGTDQQYADIGKFVADLGAGLTFVTVAGADTDPSSEDAKKRTAGIDFLKRVHDWAVIANAVGIVGPMALAWGQKYGFEGYADRAKRAGESLRKVAAHSKGSPLKFWGLEGLTGWEILGPNTVEQVADIIEMVDDDKFGALWDMSHETHEGGGAKALAAGFKRLGKKLFHVHISAPRRGDPRRSWLDTLLPTYLNALDTAFYEGDYVVEIFGPDVPGFREGVSLTWPPHDDKFEVMLGTIEWARKGINII